jgi:hypothetical protein
MLFAMVIKTMQLHVLLRLVDATTLLVSFDLLMSKVDVDTFALVINYLNESWMPQHVTIGLFKVHETARFSIANQLCSLLRNYDVMHRMITFVKDKGNNLISMATTLRSIVNCCLLKLQLIYEGMCFGHIMSKAY